MNTIILLATICMLLGLCLSATLDVPAFPACVSICMSNSTDPCSADSLPAFISCMDAECAANSALSRFTFTYSPRVEYSCQQSYVPGDSSAPARVTISGLGRCATSPYDFQSFLANGNNSAPGDLCHLEVYPEADCVGGPDVLTISDSFEKCYFQGGRSARLDCVPNADDTMSLRYAQAVCGTSSVSRFLNSTTDGFNSSALGIGNNGTNRTDTAAPFVGPGLMPYISSVAEKKSDARIAALFALVAAIAIL